MAIPTKDERALKQATDKVNAAGLKLMLKEAFYAVLFLSLKRKFIDGGTMGTNGKEILFGIAFVNSLNQYNMFFILLHEVLHVTLKHNLRGHGLDPRVANNAMDYCINLLIVELGGGSIANRQMPRDPYYQMPPDGLFNWDYAGMTFEEVYALEVKREEAERKQQQGQPQPNDGETQPGSGGDEPSEGTSPPSNDEPSEGEKEDTGNGAGDQGDCPWGGVTQLTNGEDNDLTPEEMREAELEVAQRIQQAVAIAKSRGQMGATTKAAIELADAPSQDYDDLLRDAMQATMPVDFSYARPNRYHNRGDLVCPSTEQEGLGHVGFWIDASGSVTQPEYSQFMTDVSHILEEMNPARITIIYFDGSAAEPIEYENGDTLELVRSKDGGTDFRTPFKMAEKHGLEHDIDICIFLTDGGDNTFPEEPPYPVIWATTGAWWGGPPPFGECVQVKFGKGEG